MQKVAAVEEARTLLEAAKDWGVWKWLTEKSKMRNAADQAWVALEEVEEKIRAGWSDDLQKAYNELTAQAAVADGGAPAKKKYEKAKKDAEGASAAVKTQAKKLKEGDVEAFAIRMAAEDLFAEAEKKMSTSIAKDAVDKALEAYTAREKLLKKFETAGKAK